jgi:hypothetical protein
MLSIVFEDDSLDTSVQEAVETECRLAWDLISGISPDSAATAANIIVRYTSRLGATVIAAKRAFNPGAEYDLDRFAGGVVAAKTICTADDRSSFTIAFDSSFLVNQWGRMSTIAHELCHVRLDVSRSVRTGFEGSSEGVQLADLPLATAFCMADEYRADLVADTFMRQATTPPTGKLEYFGDPLPELLRSFDLAKDWRRGEVTPGDVFDLLTMVMRVQATLDSSNRHSPGAPLLEGSAFRSHIVALLINEPVCDFIRRIRSVPPIPPKESIDEVDNIIAQASVLLGDAFEVLGITIG